MKVYLASPWVSKKEMPEIAGKIREAGGEITHAWWQIEDGKNDGSIEDLAYHRGHAQLDVEGVEKADVVVVMNTASSEGKAVEQGIAIALGKPIIIVGTQGEFSKNVFHYLGNYKWVPDVDTMVEAISTINWLLTKGG